MQVALKGYFPAKDGEVTASQLQIDLPSLTPLSVAGCDRLQLGAPHWTSSVALLQVRI